MQFVFKIIANQKFIFVLFVGLVVFATLQSILLTEPSPENGPRMYTLYDNYLIFKQSFFHLIHKQDLYIRYPEECWDFFKYSPAFAMIFGVFAYLPNWLGLFLWNFLNALVLLIAVYSLPKIEVKQKNYMLFIIALELMTCLQNSQSNGLIAGLLILAFCMLEKENILLATLFISLTIFIKLFGIVACVLFLFYPKKIRIALYMFLWCSILLLIPGLFCGFDQLLFLYKSWFNLLANDHSASVGFSILGFIQSWFKIEPNKTVVLSIGLILLLIPFVQLKKYKSYYFRLATLASILIWIVIFNHKAESPTFVIAISGVSIWFFTQKTSKLNMVLLVLAIIFTCLAPTDIFPKYVRQQIFEVYVVKAVPCILVWIKITYDLFFSNLLEKNIELPK